jgi:hypothetical protein
MINIKKKMIRNYNKGREMKILPGVKSSRHVGLTALLPSVCRMSENVGGSTSRNPKGHHGLYFTLPLLVILAQQECKHKINSSIQDNHFIKINNNPTKQYQQIIKETLKQCNKIIQEENRWKYMNMNPTVPKLYATIKLHKLNTPIRPISI